MSLSAPLSLLQSAAGASPAQRFVLASSDWLDLQSRVQAILALPSNIGEYQERYGDASSGGQMAACFNAMFKLRQACAGYGDPGRLRARVLADPGCLASAARPAGDAFSATVWTMEKAHRDAAALASFFAGLPQLVMGRPLPEIATGIKASFCNQGGIIDQMTRTAASLGSLLDQFQQIDAALADAQESMQIYTERASSTRSDLDREIGALHTTISQLESQREDAYKKWIALTVAAFAVPAVLGIVGVSLMVLLAVPSGGSSFAIGTALTAGAATVAAGALGMAAGAANGTYADLCKQVDAKNDFLAKRVCYRSDLSALDETMRYTLPASGGVATQLRLVLDGWNGAIGEFTSRAAELNAGNLSTSIWLQRGQTDAIAASWGAVDAALQGFNAGCFVDATWMPFGGALPASDPDWQHTFANLQAA